MQCAIIVQAVECRGTQHRQLSAAQAVALRTGSAVQAVQYRQCSTGIGTQDRQCSTGSAVQAVQYRQLSAAQVHRMRLDRINMLQPALCVRIIQDACIELGLCNPNQIVSSRRYWRTC